MAKRSWLAVFALLVAAAPAFAALTTKSIAQGLTPAEVAAKITGPGASITNIKITGNTASLGTFEGGTLGVSSGIILSSGNVATAVGPNNSSGAGANFSGTGDTQLTAIVAPQTTHDAAILEFDVVTKTPFFNIRYVFASEEYREYVDHAYNDVFAFFVDGRNIALTPGTDKTVTINTINHLRNTAFYRDNEDGVGTEFDGYTVPLVAVATVEPNVVHRIKIAIADTADFILDSAVFIAEGGITGTTAPALVPSFTELFLEYEVPQEFTIPIYYVFPTIPYELSATGVPGLNVTFSPVFTGADGRQYTKVKFVATRDAAPSSSFLSLNATTADAQRSATVLVHIDCRPPAILGLGQPSTQTVARGSTAKLTVTPFGSAPYTYQWYTGFTGMTGSPVSGGTGATLTTGAVNEFTPYWVRISNPCGSTDSNTAFAIPQ